MQKRKLKTTTERENVTFQQRFGEVIVFELDHTKGNHLDKQIEKSPLQTNGNV